MRRHRRIRSRGLCRRYDRMLLYRLQLTQYALAYTMCLLHVTIAWQTYSCHQGTLHVMPCEQLNNTCNFAQAGNMDQPKAAVATTELTRIPGFECRGTNAAPEGQSRCAKMLFNVLHAERSVRHNAIDATTVAHWRCVHGVPGMLDCNEETFRVSSISRCSGCLSGGIPAVFCTGEGRFRRSFRRSVVCPLSSENWEDNGRMALEPFIFGY
jgi:hypothetical protein